MENIDWSMDEEHPQLNPFTCWITPVEEKSLKKKLCAALHKKTSRKVNK
jgi:hypothetical protein